MRSYPDAPAGYPEFPLVLTSDSRGYRNTDNLQQYDVVAVGDSFVAGSHVSDEQAWVALLRKSTGQTIYNTGVSGTNPLTYLNNFITVGRAFKPKTVLLMLYEGNDFRNATAANTYWHATTGLSRSAFAEPRFLRQSFAGDERFASPRRRSIGKSGQSVAGAWLCGNGWFYAAAFGRQWQAAGLQF
ncbi:MAG: hypothetical protein R3E67_06415 [Pseudomonadales bacterium]